MKVYLASPYSQKEQMKIYAAELRAGDVICTASWLDEPHSPATQLSEVSPEDNKKYAIQDIKDVQAADILVFFADSTKTIVRAGRHVEFGIAVQRRIPIYVIGGYENIFHFLPRVIHFTKWELVRDMLIALQGHESDLIMS